MPGPRSRDFWWRVRSKANDVLATAHKALFVALAGALAFAVYHLIQAVQTQAPPTSDWISIVALAASAYTAWYTHWWPPNISVRLAWDGQTWSEHEKLGLIFYNSGMSGTYLKIESLSCSDHRIEVHPTFVSARRVEAKGMELVLISLRAVEHRTLPQGILPTWVQVSYRFWRGRHEVSRKRMIRIAFDERSGSHG